MGLGLFGEGGLEAGALEAGGKGQNFGLLRGFFVWLV